MKAFLTKLAELQNKVGQAINRIPFWPDIVALARQICAPLVHFSHWTLKVAPWLHKFEWLLEVESLTKRHPVPLAFSMVYVIWRGLHTTPLGHIGTDPMIYPFLGGISGFNPFLGIVCASLFSVADFAQKFVWPDIYGARGWTDANYWGAMIGYLVAYSSVLTMALLPGMLSRVFRAIVQSIIRKVLFARASAAADGALPASGGKVLLADMIAGATGAFAGGYLTMHEIAPITERPAFMWRPHPDISCHKLEVATHLKGRAGIGGIGAAIGGVVPTLPPPDGGSPPPSDSPATPQTPPDIDYTYPDGRKTTLVFDPKKGGYINILTGGLVDPNSLDTWKQSNQAINDATNDWRAHNQTLTATHQDAQSQAIQSIKDQAAIRDKYAQNLSTMQQGIIFGTGPQSDFYRPPGTPGSMLDRIKELQTQLDNHEPIDTQKYQRLTKVYTDAVKGNILPESHIPTSNELTRDIINTTASNTANEVLTGQKADGSISVLGTITRILTAAVTQGTSEIILTPASTLKGMKDYVDKGGNSALEGFGQAVKEVIKGEAIGMAGGAAIKVAGSAGKFIASTLSPTGERIAGTLKNLKNSLSTGGKTITKGANPTPYVKKMVTAAEAAENKVARAQARINQQGTGKYSIQSAPEVNVADQMKGMTNDAHKHAQMIADKHNVSIDVRPTTKYAAELIREGKAVPKIPDVKTKTINDLDLALGAKSESKGMAGYFDPKKPIQGDMPKDKFDQLMRRYNERKQEFKDQFEHLTKSKNDGKVFVKDGVVHDAKTGKPFTGDHDVFDIRDPLTGKPLPRYQLDPKGNVIMDSNGMPKLNPVREQVMKELQQPPFNAQHGSHMDWKYDHLDHEVPTGSPAGVQSDYDIAKGVDRGVLGKHTASGGDALISINSDHPPTASWFNGDR